MVLGTVSFCISLAAHAHGGLGVSDCETLARNYALQEFAAQNPSLNTASNTNSAQVSLMPGSDSQDLKFIVRINVDGPAMPVLVEFDNSGGDCKLINLQPLDS